MQTRLQCIVTWWTSCTKLGEIISANPGGCELTNLGRCSADVRNLQHPWNDVWLFNVTPYAIGMERSTKWCKMMQHVDWPFHGLWTMNNQRGDGMARTSGNKRTHKMDQNVSLLPILVSLLFSSQTGGPQFSVPRSRDFGLKPNRLVLWNWVAICCNWMFNKKIPGWSPHDSSTRACSTTAASARLRGW
jgi:hypothetical protein